jgi:hypothetical protein
MEFLPYDLRFALRANDVCRRAAAVTGRAEPDSVPVLKLFNPGGTGTWFATRLASDGDTLFGLSRESGD